MAFLVPCLLALGAQAEEYSYVGNVVRVIDGDSLIVDVPDWPARVRVSGVNAPETRRRQAKCAIERELGKQMSAWVREKLPKGSEVTLIWEGPIARNTGRLLARVIMPDGQDMAEVQTKPRLSWPMRMPARQSQSRQRKRSKWLQKRRKSGYHIAGPKH